MGPPGAPEYGGPMTQLPSAVSVRESGTGTPLVLLHAFPLSAAMWSAQLETLPGPTGDRARVVAPDQRGFGGAGLGSEEPSLDTVADDVARLLDAAGIDRTVLGGLSMGGYVAMAFAERHPDRLAGLLLANTKATADPGPTRANRERIAAAVLARESVRLLLDERTAAVQLGPDSQHLVDRVEGMIAAAPCGHRRLGAAGHGGPSGAAGRPGRGAGTGRRAGGRGGRADARHRGRADGAGPAGRRADRAAPGGAPERDRGAAWPSTRSRAGCWSGWWRRDEGGRCGGRMAGTSPRWR